MTNNEIITAAVRNAFTPAQLAELTQTTNTPEQLAADLFHTFAEWKRLGYSVKKGEHAALVCNLWKYTDKPGKALKKL